MIAYVFGNLLEVDWTGIHDIKWSTDREIELSLYIFFKKPLASNWDSKKQLRNV